MLPILRRITFWLRRPSPVRTQTTVTTSTQTSGECLSCTMTYRKHSPQNHGLYEICSFEGQTQMVYWRDGVAKPCVSTTLPVHQECSTSYWFRPRPFLMEKNPCLLEIATIFLGGQMAQIPVFCGLKWSHPHFTVVTSMFANFKFSTHQVSSL